MGRLRLGGMRCRVLRCCVSSWRLLPQEPVFGLPGITGRDLQEVARVKRSTAGGPDSWAWNEVLAMPWFSGWAILLELVESTGVWSLVYWMPTLL